MNIDAFTILPLNNAPFCAGGELSRFLPLSSASSMEIGFMPTLASSTVRVLVHLDVWGWKLVRPVKLTIEVDEDGTHIASDEEFAQYGEGSSIDRAIDDYVSSLLEYYEVLEARATNHKATAELLRRLRSVVTKNSTTR
jgi:hypothetical protein